MVATYPGLVGAPTSTLDGAAPSQAWLDALRDPVSRDEAAARLHALLLRAARFELARRRRSLTGIAYHELDDLAVQAADDALVAVLGKLETFRGESRFTTWAYKFALLEAGVRLRRRAWRDREVALDDDPAHPALRDNGPSVHARVEEAELLAAVRTAIQTQLTSRQREVLVALTLDGVPIDVLAERLHTTRGALYKVLHDARRKLRAAIGEERLEVTT
jgi:RNA polymerase sigma-70 factor (ECF subfamily)